MTLLGSQRSSTLVGPQSEEAGSGHLLKVGDLHKTFKTEARGGGDRTTTLAALDGVSFHVDAGQVFTLLGPSGCGKSTTLRAIAGIERPDAGTIVLRGRTLFDSSKGIWVRPNSRRLGMVFQTYAIWPHMSVFENVAFPLRATARAARLPEAEIRQRVHEVLEMVGLGHLERRPATQLSGGQQQRVAVARALVGRPDIVLMDEPFSNLDTKLRESMRLETQRLQRDLGLTVVFVTHDQTEALSLSDRIAVLRDGKVAQIGSPAELYREPRNVFVAEATGSANIMTGRVSRLEGDACTVQTPEGSWAAKAAEGVGAGDEVDLAIRPEALRLAGEPGSLSGEQNVFLANVLTVSYQGEVVEHLLAVGKTSLRSRSEALMTFAPGSEVWISAPADRVLALPK